MRNTALIVLLLFALGRPAGAEGAAARNLALLPNQDFEEAPLGWGQWPDDSQSRLDLDNQVAQHGRQSLRVTAVRASDRAFATASTRAFETEIVYRVSLSVRKDPQVEEQAISVAINYRGGADEAIRQRARPVQLAKVPEGDWVRWSGLFLTPKGVTSWQFLLGVEFTVGRVWFDNIRIERLGAVADLQPDVWTNLTLGVEIGSAPLQRFAKHKDANDVVYQRALRYNALLMDSAFAEKDLRDLERCCAYAGRPAPERARALFGESEQLLNRTYQAYGAAFTSGKEEDARAFAAGAEALEHALQGLRAEVGQSLRRLRPANAPPLPARLGRQERRVPPFQANGRMNRLLFGAWSPTHFTDFEKPFDLEFHSSAPGTPRAHTEAQLDFGNITEACDLLEKAGYAGTFGYLPFGIHEYLYAPAWLVEKHKDEPDFYKASWDGLKGGSRGSDHSLNFLHPAVREYIRDYLGKYASFCKNEPRVLFYETAQEAYPDFGTPKGRRETGYGPHGIRAFREYLQARHKSIAALNRAWGTAYADFGAIEPPPDAYAQPQRGTVPQSDRNGDTPAGEAHNRAVRKSEIRNPKSEIGITPLVAEFEAFRDDAYIGYLKLIYQSLKAADPGKPVVSRHSALLNSINGARLFETCDVLSYHRGAPQMQLMNVYLNSLNRYHRRGLGYMEDFWGLQEERASDEVVQRRGLEKHIAQECTWGRTLQMKWYSYTAGAYIFTYNGNWMNPRYDVTTMRYAAPALAVAKRKMESLDWVLTHSSIAPARVLVLQPSATMRNERPDQDVYQEIHALHALLTRSGIPYELLPEEYVADGRARLADFDAVILPRARYLAGDLQRALLKFAQSGGTLVACGRPASHDDLARPADLLVPELLKGVPAASTALVERVWGSESPAPEGKGWAALRCGKGQLVASIPLSQGGTEEGKRALAGLLAATARRAAWSEASRFEVVLRTAEDGGRYLFLLNPDVDRPAEDTVRVGFPAKSAVDVTIPEGFPVKVSPTAGGASLAVRLGPGETAVVFLR